MWIPVASAVLSTLCLWRVVEASGFRGVNVHEEFARRIKELEQERAKSREHLAGHVEVKIAEGIKPSIANLAEEEWKVIQKSIQMPLDHKGKTDATFPNRYWVYEKFYKPGGPIFIFDAGEWDPTNVVEIYLTNEGSVFREFFESFGGMGIVWEHRYYGQSTPTTVSVYTSPDQFQYLTTEQALADIAYFADRFESNATAAEGVDLTPKGSPWIFVGGSYPGMRASFMRAKYPDTIFASYSSSAPLQARVDMGGYYDQIYRGIAKALGTACPRSIVSAIKYIDEQLSASAESATAIKKAFLGPGAEVNPNGEFAEALASLFWDFQSGGAYYKYQFPGQPEGVGHSIADMCEHITTDEAGNKAPPEGWEKEKGSKWIAERWSEYPALSQAISYKTGAACGGAKANPDQAGWSCNLTYPYSGSDAIAWRWQYCIEWGFFQVANEGPNQIVSKFNNIDHHRKNCQDQFPTGLASGFMPDLPSVDETNKLFGGWSEGSHQLRTFYTAGEFDPWTSLSFFSKETYAPKGVNVTQKIPECNEKTAPDEIFGYLLPNAVHTMDLVAGESSQATRDLFKVALSKWLLCWKPPSVERSVMPGVVRGNNSTMNGTIKAEFGKNTTRPMSSAALLRRAREWRA